MSKGDTNSAEGLASAGAGETKESELVDKYPGRVVIHRRLGVWDYYEEANPDSGRLSLVYGFREWLSEMKESAPYIARIIRDILNIPGCKVHVGIYALTDMAANLLPALSLWYEGQLIKMLDVAVQTRSVHARRLLRICAARIACTVAKLALGRVRTRAENTLNSRISRFFKLHTFRAFARVDVPTFADRSVREQLHEAASDHSDRTVVFSMFRLVTQIVSGSVQLGTEMYVLLNALKDQKHGRLLALVTLVVESLAYLTKWGFVRNWPIAYAVSTRHKAYQKMTGWALAVREEEHRKELVAGNLAGHALSEYKAASEAVGDDERSWQEWRDELTSDTWPYLHDVLVHVPQIVFTLSAIKSPMHMPEALASLNLVQNAARGLSTSMWETVRKSRIIGYDIRAARDLYEIVNIPNVVRDGTVPFPTSPAQIESGVSLEFRNVSFKYPDTDKWALHNVSFNLLPGQLCVIVGSNGAGKSTILKLIVRLYDPQEGQILVGGHDIRELRLSDLRQAISVLFQDYTHFPLSIRDNIALGDPTTSGDDNRVRLAARMGGAEAFIEKLPEGFDTYFNSAWWEMSGPPPGSKTRDGKPFDKCAVRDAAGIKQTTSFELSGGQMQRLAVARTFMRSIVPEDVKVGLLLFDEPSASLDPAAEHDLFDRLRELRGSKTMVFSTHRFGNLT